ncbi:hypothetical protein [Bradyrhizobium murdochi]|uniref:hypothetical protein n=1 Tax=Bradyrhizobium murdochi TaxID=1038859 RepID=UPI0012ECB2EB|nr:hypothetical protein [Bradyrhizobium murdochi]
MVQPGARSVPAHFTRYSTGEFIDDPLTVDLMLRRVMQNVQSDEPGKQIFELQVCFIEFRIWNATCRRSLTRKLPDGPSMFANSAGVVGALEKAFKDYERRRLALTSIRGGG